jgi:hypothetical protein
VTDAACPPADALLGFVAGALTAAAARSRPIDACAACRAALSSAARGAATGGASAATVETVLGAAAGVVYRGRSGTAGRWRSRWCAAIAAFCRRARAAGARARHLARLSHPHVCHVYDAA